MEKNQILLLGEEIEYTIRTSSKAKHLRLTISRNGELIISAPRRLPQKYILQFIAQKADWIVQTSKKNKIRAKNQLTDDPSRYLALKDLAYQLVIERILFFNQYYQYTYQKVFIKNQQTRWGSCSSLGNLNFNYRICLLDPHLRDYIIVHELCHLRQMNHSRNFWSLVEETIPNYRQCVKELKELGLSFV